MNVEFVASIAPVSADPTASRRLYVDTVGLPLEGDGYIHSETCAREQILRYLAARPSCRSVLRHVRMARGPSGSPGVDRIRRGRRGFGSRRRGRPARRRLRDPALNPNRAVGPDGRATFVAGGVDHRNLIRALAT